MHQWRLFDKQKLEVARELAGVYNKAIGNPGQPVVERAGIEAVELGERSKWEQLIR